MAELDDFPKIRDLLIAGWELAIGWTAGKDLILTLVTPDGARSGFVAFGTDLSEVRYAIGEWEHIVSKEKG
jgi:hypothetical protein